MERQCCFERDIAARHEVLGDGKRMNRVTSIASRQHITTTLQADEGPVFQSAVDKAITARVTAAQQLGELPVIQKTISQSGCRNLVHQRRHNS